MGKNKDGRRSTKKNSKKNTFKKYGKYTSRSLRISEAQTNNQKKQSSEGKGVSNTQSNAKIIFPLHYYMRK